MRGWNRSSIGAILDYNKSRIGVKTMATKYTAALIHLLESCQVTVPDNIRADQTLTPYLIAHIQRIVDSVAEGTAGPADVLAPATFSSAGGVQQTGTATLAGLTANADAVAEDIRLGKTAYVAGELVVGAAATLADLTANADAVAEDIRLDKTAYVAGELIVGTAEF